MDQLEMADELDGVKVSIARRASEPSSRRTHRDREDLDDDFDDDFDFDDDDDVTERFVSVDVWDVEFFARQWNWEV